MNLTPEEMAVLKKLLGDLSLVNLTQVLSQEEAKVLYPLYMKIVEAEKKEKEKICMRGADEVLHR